MKALDVQALFARAERAFTAGRLNDASRDLSQVQHLAGEHPAVLHLVALVAKRSGNRAAARRAFERAAALAPHDPQIANNFANLLQELGEGEAALRFYAAALSVNPAFRDARYNRALLLQELGRLQEALADLETICQSGSADAKTYSARGSVLRDLGRLDEAAASYDEALRLEATRLATLHGRARVAMERGEHGASGFYRRALQQSPADLDLTLGLAEASEAEGDPVAVEVLKQAVEAHPEWTVGHEALARMRSEAGDAERFADHYRKALESRPTDRALHYSHWQSLARSERYGEALEALRRARDFIADDPRMLLMEAIFTSEAGDAEAGLRLLERLGRDLAAPYVQFARGRMSLRAGDAEQAAALLEQTVAADPGSVNGWAHLELSWRLIGDPRHEWLACQPGLYGTRKLGLGAAELQSLALLLRTLHRARSHPIGQSLRRGTQTRGRLFARSEPEIRRLHDAIAAAVRDHFRALPPKDEAHPLLRHRDAEPRIEGSWSVRLTSLGFHVNHIHPEGVLSSACYIALPDTLGSEGTREGWLELGRPPTELGLPLEPLSAVRPEPGLLALFPSYMFHGTRSFSLGERLTVAFDVVA